MQNGLCALPHTSNNLASDRYMRPHQSTTNIQICLMPAIAVDSLKPSPSEAPTVAEVKKLTEKYKKSQRFPPKDAELIHVLAYSFYLKDAKNDWMREGESHAQQALACGFQNWCAVSLLVLTTSLEH